MTWTRLGVRIGILNSLVVHENIPPTCRRGCTLSQVASLHLMYRLRLPLLVALQRIWHRMGSKTLHRDVIFFWRSVARAATVFRHLTICKKWPTHGVVAPIDSSRPPRLDESASNFLWSESLIWRCVIALYDTNIIDHKVCTPCRHPRTDFLEKRNTHRHEIRQSITQSK